MLQRMFKYVYTVLVAEIAVVCCINGCQSCIGYFHMLLPWTLYAHAHVDANSKPKASIYRMPLVCYLHPNVSLTMNVKDHDYISRKKSAIFQV